jgi:hypothetical protein
MMRTRIEREGYYSTRLTLARDVLSQRCLEAGSWRELPASKTGSEESGRMFPSRRTDRLGVTATRSIRQKTSFRLQASDMDRERGVKDGRTGVKMS